MVKHPAILILVKGDKDMAKKKKTKKKLTPMQAAYQKELKRISKYMRRKIREGFEFEDSLDIPDMPKRVTQKALAKITKLTGWVLRKQLKPVIPTPPTSTPVSMPVITDTQLSVQREVWDEISRFMSEVQKLPAKHIDKVTEIINEWINRLGPEDVAEALSNMPRRAIDFIKPGTSDFDYDEFTTEFLAYLPGLSEGAKQDIEDLTSQILTGEYYV